MIVVAQRSALGCTLALAVNCLLGLAGVGAGNSTLSRWDTSLAYLQSLPAATAAAQFLQLLRVWSGKVSRCFVMTLSPGQIVFYLDHQVRAFFPVEEQHLRIPCHNTLLAWVRALLASGRFGAMGRGGIPPRAQFSSHGAYFCGACLMWHLLSSFSCLPFSLDCVFRSCLHHS